MNEQSIEKVKQGVVSIIEFPIGQDELAVSKAISQLLKEGWEFVSLTKNTLCLKRMWEFITLPSLIATRL